MASVGKIARRTFLIGTGFVAGGLAIGYYFYRKPWDNPLVAGDGEAVFNPFVKIGADNTVTVIVPRAEMGQGVTTTLAALVAEELDADLDQVTVEHGPESAAYYNTAVAEDLVPFAAFNRSGAVDTMRSVFGASGKMLGLQVTGVSSSTRDAYERMRYAGCAARTVLKEAAARQLGVPSAQLKTRSGMVIDEASNKSLTYGELAEAAAAIEVPGKLELRPKGEWKLLGKPQPRVDLRAKVTGAPVFGIDVDLPDMLYGTVKMSPRFWAKVKSADLSRAEKMPGVVKIVPLETMTGNGFGIIADNTWAAFRAAEAIAVEWEEAEYPADSDAQTAILRAEAENGSGWSLRNDGDAESAIVNAPGGSVIEARYDVPYLAHACMEPMNATARFKDGKLELWAPNQVPSIIQFACSLALDMSMNDISIATTFLGGGFGRRLEWDYALYAALLSRETGGRPVKVTWTREEDITHDAYRPAAAARFSARIGDDGYPVALDASIASPSLLKSYVRRILPFVPLAGPERYIVEGAFDQPYTIPNYRVTGVESEISVPVGSWRSVGNSFNAFFHECFLDEIAARSGLDPIAMRLKLMAEYPTAVKLMKELATLSEWGEALPDGKAKGVAFTLSFGSWVGQVVQVAQTPEGIRIEKVWAVADVGEALDPAILEAQIMSAAVFGLSSAIGQEITFADGMVEQSNFHDFDAMRMAQCPQFEVRILENSGWMGGAGEIGTPPSIPALANAVYALTGKRIRSLPLSREVNFA